MATTLKVWYDQEADFLEVIFEDAPAFLDEVNEDVFERRTPDGRIIGFAVLNFSRHDRDTLQLPLSVTAVPHP
ncbi:MAG: DUF2283 domain-containing protein [Chloroflexi bacterium]|nr:DUF2283 domain-containing protein [Chloroflexota bacterium]